MGSRVARPPSASVYRRRRLAAVAALAVVLAAAVVVCSARAATTRHRPARAGAMPRRRRSRRRAAARRAAPILPTTASSRSTAPRRPTSSASSGSARRPRGRRLLRQAKPYERKTRPVLPAMELIAVIASAHPGEGGCYNTPVPSHDRALPQGGAQDQGAPAARHPARPVGLLHGGHTAAQVARAARRRARHRPRVADGARPGPGTGHRPGRRREVNATSAWLAQLVKRHNLRRSCLSSTSSPTTWSPSGRSSRGRSSRWSSTPTASGRSSSSSRSTTRSRATTRTAFHQGFKLFYREDTDLMTPRQTLALRPPPDLVVYE